MRVAAAVLSILILGLLAGCGGGDDGSDPVAFKKEANEVCVKANTEAGATLLDTYASAQFKNSSSTQRTLQLEEEVIVPILVKNAKAQFDGISALDAPSEGGEEVEAILKSYETWIKKAKAEPDKIVAENDIYNEARKLAKKYGLAKCGQTPYDSPYTTPS